MFSVEHIPVADKNNCWNQYALCRWKWSARLARFNVFLALRGLGIKSKTRIRKV